MSSRCPHMPHAFHCAAPPKYLCSARPLCRADRAARHTYVPRVRGPVRAGCGHGAECDTNAVLQLQGSQAVLRMRATRVPSPCQERIPRLVRAVAPRRMQAVPHGQGAGRAAPQAQARERSAPLRLRQGAAPPPAAP